MNALTDFNFQRPDFTPTDPRPLVVVVIIQTVMSGRVRRKHFKDWDAAHECAEKWRNKNHRKQTYKISVEVLL